MQRVRVGYNLTEFNDRKANAGDPTYVPSLNLSDYRNSQYLAALGILSPIYHPAKMDFSSRVNSGLLVTLGL